MQNRTKGKKNTSRGIKRKQRSVACQACRRDHLKCDNQSPCGRCAKKKIECVYTAAKKRGPVKGYKNKLVKEREELRARIQGQREELLQLRNEVQLLTNAKTIIPRVGTSLNIAAEVTSYLDTYQFIYAPWQGVYAGQWTAQSLLESLRGSTWVADPVILEVFLLVGIGAHLRGRPEHGVEFCNMANTVFACLGQTNHPCIASALALMSTYHFLFGDISVVGYYLALANDMLPKLNSSDSNLELIVDTTKTYCKLLSADFQPNVVARVAVFQDAVKDMKKKNVTITEGFHYLWGAGSIIRSSITPRVFNLDSTRPELASLTFSEGEYRTILFDLNKLEEFIRFELVGKGATFAVEVAQICLYAIQAIAHFGGNEIQTSKLVVSGAWCMLRDRWSIFIHFPLAACIFQDCALVAAYTLDVNLFNDVLYGFIAFAELWPLCIEIIKLVMLHADRVGLHYNRAAAVERIATRLHVFLPTHADVESISKIKEMPARLAGGSNRSQEDINFNITARSPDSAPIHIAVSNAPPRRSEC